MKGMEVGAFQRADCKDKGKIKVCLTHSVS